MGPLGWFHISGGLSLLAWSALAWWSRTARVPVAAVLAILVLCWICLMVAWRKSAALSSGRALAGIWFWAVLFRAAGLAGQPVLEDDYFRYLWDGYRFATDGSPYGAPPAAFFGDPAVDSRFLPILDGINHPHLATVYGPVSEWAFRLAYWISPGDVAPWKWIAIAADLATLALISRMASPSNALLYAWCPLLIQECAFTAHPESLGVLALVAALYLCRRGAVAAAAVAVVVAAGVKIVGALLLPFVLWRGGWRACLAAAGAAAAVWLPFAAFGNSAEWPAVRTMAAEWEFNSSLFAIATGVAGRTVATVVCLAAMAAGAFCLWKQWTGKTLREAPPGDRVYAGFFLLSPVVNPWYLLWLLPFAALRPTAWALAAMAAVSMSYLCGIHLGDPNLDAYQHPGWLRVLEYGAVLAAAVWRRGELAA